MEIYNNFPDLPPLLGQDLEAEALRSSSSFKNTLKEDRITIPRTVGNPGHYIGFIYGARRAAQELNPRLLAELERLQLENENLRKLLDRTLTLPEFNRDAAKDEASGLSHIREQGATYTFSDGAFWQYRQCAAWLKDLQQKPGTESREP